MASASGEARSRASVLEDEFRAEDNGAGAAPAADADDDDALPQPASYDEFWAQASQRNASAMRAAGLDPSKPPDYRSRHGFELVNGVPKDPSGGVACWSCGKPTTQRFECCQCLEIFKARCARVAGGAGWERAFFCDAECYAAVYAEHKARHGPSTAGPHRLDGRTHHFDPAPGNGALWDAQRLRRLEFPKLERYQLSQAASNLLGPD